MKGSHKVIVETERIKYTFTIRRNITIVLGDSATGKTTLVDYLNMYSHRGSGSGVTVQSDVSCVVLNTVAGHWQGILSEITRSIIFIDEGQPFIFSKDFADAVRGSDNYYVLITRRPIYNLPYSTKEIYGIRTIGKYHFPEKVYQEFYPIYDQAADHPAFKGDVLLLEDSGAGYQFFEKALPNIRCISAAGNAQIINKLKTLNKEDQTVVFADGAAFGAFIESVLTINEYRGNTALYLPESFEWMILQSGVINSAEISDILEHPEDFIDSSVYLSWERFFTELLEKTTVNDEKIRYNKIRLADYYLSTKCVYRILDVIPETIRDYLTSAN